MIANRFLLTQAQHAALYRKITQQYFAATFPVAHPVAIILGGQPGAGKSDLLEACKLEFADRNLVSINGDELRYYHPQYKEIQNSNERHFAELTDPHVRLWTTQLFGETINTRRNVAFEGTMRESAPITATLLKIQQAGYFSVVKVIAASECDSLMGIRRRYEEQKAVRGVGRWASASAHDAAYTGMPETVFVIEQRKLANRIEVYSRSGQCLYSNECAGGSWAASPCAVEVITAERLRQPSADERSQRKQGWNEILELMRHRNASPQEIAEVSAVAARCS